MSFIDFSIRPRSGNLLQYGLLQFLSFIYLIFYQMWRWLYKIKFKKPYKSNKIVISIGNISVGGTGKTPMIGWFIEYLKQSHISNAVLTRGYKSENQIGVLELNSESAPQKFDPAYGDEPWMLWRNHRETRFYISPDRVSAAKLAEKEVDILLLDDGMQHLRLSRDLNVVLIDSTAGIGNGKIFPLGPLREPLKNLNRADIILYTKTNLKEAAEIRAELQPYIPASIAQFDIQYLVADMVCFQTGKRTSPKNLKGKDCCLFSGIGNPNGFAQTILKTGANIVKHLVFDDHQIYNKSLISQLKSLGDDHPKTMILCTEKDWVKLESLVTDLPEIYYLVMKVQVPKEMKSFLNQYLLK